MFRDATRPADSANPVGMDINLDGTVAHAYSDKLVNNTSKDPVFMVYQENSINNTTVQSH